MSEKSACCCSGLPKFWWWLTALLGLLLLFLAMIMTRQSVVEADIQTRTEEKLKAANHEGVEVSLQGRGRDVLLSGMAVSDEAKADAIKIARAVNGVRVVDDQITVTAPLASSEVAIEKVDGTATLRGKLPSQQAIDELVAAGAATFGQENLRNELQLSEGVADAGWLSSVVAVMPEMAGMNKAMFKVNDEGASLTGEVPEAGLKDSIMAALAKWFGGTSQADLMVADTSAMDAEAEAAARAEAEAAARAEAEAEAVAKTEADRLACQKSLNDTMAGKSILFATNKADIREASHALLGEIGVVLERCKSVVTVKGLTIDGHTDDRGDAEYNQGLSQRRADAVKAYLVTQGVNASLITANGHGETKPVASNDTAEGRAQNRRITFTIEQN